VAPTISTHLTRQFASGVSNGGVERDSGREKPAGLRSTRTGNCEGQMRQGERKAEERAWNWFLDHISPAGIRSLGKMADACLLATLHSWPAPPGLVIFVYQWTGSLITDRSGEIHTHEQAHWHEDLSESATP
jgi:hypothetical protein